MYSIFVELLQRNGVSTYQVSKATGIAQSVFSSWKNGISKPKADKLKKFADRVSRLSESGREALSHYLDLLLKTEGKESP